MKTNKYVEDLKAKSAADLAEELVSAKKELFNLRFQNATNQIIPAESKKFARTLPEFRLLLQKKLTLQNNSRQEGE